MSLIILALLIGLMALMALVANVRLAPSDPGQWHIDLNNDRPAALQFTLFPPGSDLVVSLMNGAHADLFVDETQAYASLHRLDAIALATPRTQRIAGSPGEGHVTWVTRSAFWGFPDYTTAQIGPVGIAIFARLRFGRSDFGVNAARLKDWLSRL